jgi:PAS domain S-box-containing protein
MLKPLEAAPPDESTEQLHVMNQVIEVLAQAADDAIDIESIYLIALNGLQNVFGIEQSSVFLFEPGGEVKCKAWIGISEDFRTAIGKFDPWHPQSQDFLPFTIQDIKKDPSNQRLLPIFARDEVRSTTYIPLVHNKRLLGTIALYSRVPYDFEREREFTLTLSRLIVLGIMRKQSEKNLRINGELLQAKETLQKYQDLVDSVDGIVWEVTSDFRFTFVSKQAEKILGYPVDRWINDPTFWVNNIYPEDRDAALAYCVEQCEKLAHHDFEYRMIAADGRVVWLRDLVHIVADRGRIIGLRGIMVDITAYKQTTTELQKSHSLLHTTLESTADAILVIDLAGRIVSFNQNFKNFFRVPSQVIADKSESKELSYIMQQIKNPDQVLSKIIELHSHPEAESYDVLELKDGRFFERYSQPQRLGNEIIGRVWSFRDVTNRKRAEEKLRESEERFSNAFKYSAIGIALVSLEGKWLKVNQSICKMLGYSEVELETMTFQEVTHPDDLDQDLQYVQQLLEGEIDTYKMEKRYFTKSRSIVWVHLSVSLVRNRQQQPLYFIAQVEDITQRKQNEEELHQYRNDLEKKVQDRTTELSQMNAFLDSLIENIPNLIFVKDSKDLKFVRINKAVEELLGFPREQLIGKSDYDFCPKSEADHFTSVEREALARKTVVNLPEEPVHTPLKGRIILHSKKIPLYNLQGDAEYLLCVSEDITEKKQAEEILIRLAKEKEARIEAEKGIQLRDDFLSIASHELRTPLTPVRMYLGLIKQHVDALAPTLPRVDFLQKAILGADQELDRFLKLVEKLLDVSRINAGRLLLNRSDFDLSELVRSILDRFDKEIRKAGCDFHLEAKNSVVGRWDKSRIEQVIINLLTNSLKYGAKNPIEVAVCQADHKAIFQITDHGVGIPPADQKRLFQRFERGTSMKHYGGFGLGLFISKEIVLAHDGTIRLDSTAGKGSTFTVELPMGLMNS